MNYVVDLGIDIDPIEFDVSKYNLSGYGKSTINGLAFTSFTGEVEDGFNYSFGMMTKVNEQVYMNSKRIIKHQIHAPYYHNKPTKIFPSIEKAWNQIADLGIEMFRCRLSMIKANSDIPEHSDTCSEDDYCIKVHIPLITNEEARFVFGDKSYKMDRGRAYLANVAKKHSFVNPAPFDRYHIIADCIVTNSKLPFFCESAKGVIDYYNTWENVMNKKQEIDFFNQRMFA